MDDETLFLQDLIRKMMAVSGLDLTGLARKAEIAPSTLTRFMRGESKFVLSAKTLFKLSRATGVSVTYPPITPAEQENAAKWSAVIAALPPEIGDLALGTLRGLVETHRARQEHAPPLKARGVRREG